MPFEEPDEKVLRRQADGPGRGVRIRTDDQIVGDEVGDDAILDGADNAQTPEVLAGLNLDDLGSVEYQRGRYARMLIGEGDFESRVLPRVLEY